jgi:hypothetical protein
MIFTRKKAKREAVPVHTMKEYRGVEIQLHPLLPLAADGGEWSASLPGRFYPREGTPVPTE